MSELPGFILRFRGGRSTNVHMQFLGEPDASTEAQCVSEQLWSCYSTSTETWECQ